MDKKTENPNLPRFLEKVTFVDPGLLPCMEELAGLDYPVPVEAASAAEARQADASRLAAGLVWAAAAGPEALARTDEFAGRSEEEVREALAAYEALLLRLEPRIEEKLGLAGMAKLDKGDLEFAEGALLAAKNIGGSARSYADLAFLHHTKAQAARRRSARAYDLEADREVEVLREGLGRHPDDPTLLLSMGTCHMDREEEEEAAGCFRRAIANMEDGEPRRKVASLLANLESKAELEEMLFGAFDLIMMDKAPEALAQITRFLERDSAGWQGWYVKGWALRVMERFDEAREALLESVKRNADIGATYNELALCEKRLGNIELAKEYLEVAIDKEDDNAIYPANLAYLHLSQKNFDEARRCLDLARRLAPDDNQVLDLIDEYEALSGEEVGPAVVEESLPREAVGRLRDEVKEEI